MPRLDTICLLPLFHRPTRPGLKHRKHTAMETSPWTLSARSHALGQHLLSTSGRPQQHHGLSLPASVHFRSKQQLMEVQITSLSLLACIHSLGIEFSVKLLLRVQENNGFTSPCYLHPCTKATQRSFGDFFSCLQYRRAECKHFCGSHPQLDRPMLCLQFVSQWQTK